MMWRLILRRSLSVALCLLMLGAVTVPASESTTANSQNRLTVGLSAVGFRVSEGGVSVKLGISPESTPTVIDVGTVQAGGSLNISLIFAIDAGLSTLGWTTEVDAGGRPVLSADGNLYLANATVQVASWFINQSIVRLSPEDHSLRFSVAQVRASLFLEAEFDQPMTTNYSATFSLDGAGRSGYTATGDMNSATSLTVHSETISAAGPITPFLIQLESPGSELLTIQGQYNATSGQVQIPVTTQTSDPRITSYTYGLNSSLSNLSVEVPNEALLPRASGGYGNQTVATGFRIIVFPHQSSSFSTVENQTLSQSTTSQQQASLTSSTNSQTSQQIQVPANPTGTSNSTNPEQQTTAIPPISLSAAAAAVIVTLVLVALALRRRTRGSIMGRPK